MRLYKFLLFGFLSASIVGTLVSCKKKVEEVVPQDAISTELALTDANATQTLYIGVYARLRTYNSTLFNLGEMRSDIWTDGLFIESADPTSQQLYTHNISALNVPYANWAGFYNLIYNINNVISVLPKSPVTEPNKSKWLAEMHGLRAYVYYTMLKTWGGVPLTTEPVTTINNAAETYKHRSPPDSVMVQIKSDIDKSLQLFGGNNSFPAGNRVFWNRIASLTYLQEIDRKSTRLNSSHSQISYAVFCLKKKKK